MRDVPRQGDATRPRVGSCGPSQSSSPPSGTPSPPSFASCSDAAGVGAPDQLVQLERQPASIPEASSHSTSSFGSTAGTTGEKSTATRPGKPVAPGHLHRPAEVPGRGHHELHLVVRPEPVEVAEVARLLAGAGRLHVEDPDHRRRAAPRRPAGRGSRPSPPSRRSSRSRQSSGSSGCSSGSPPVRQTWRTGMAFKLGHDRLARPLLPAVEGVGGVAPGAAQVAAGEADEGAGPPGPRPLPLDAPEDLRDAHQPPSGALRSANRGPVSSGMVRRSRRCSASTRLA